MSEVTHQDMAESILTMLLNSNLQIPINKNREMGEILDWLEAIKDGKLVVSDTH